MMHESELENHVFKAMVLLMERDFEAAFPLLKIASDANQPMANFLLGKMYFYGDFVQQSDNYAFYLIKRSVDHGCIEAYPFLALMLIKGLGCEANIDKSIALLTKAAHNGCMDSPMQLAKMYLDGRYVARDYRQASYWIKVNKPHRFTLRRLTQPHTIDKTEHLREAARANIEMSLRLRWIWWKLIHPIFGRR